MKKIAVLCSGLLILLAACDRYERKVENDREYQLGTSDNEFRRDAYNADNSARNVRDRNFDTITPGNQSESAEDRAITQRIRRALVSDDSLSTDAKNIKIITIDRVVVLRGAVNNPNEKQAIARKIGNIEGIRRVDDQLEITRY